MIAQSLMVVMAKRIVMVTHYKEHDGQGKPFCFSVVSNRYELARNRERRGRLCRLRGSFRYIRSAIL